MKIIKKIFQFLKLTFKRLFSLFRKKPKRFTGEPCPIIDPNWEPKIDRRCVYQGLELCGHMDKRLLVRPVLAAEIIGYGSYEVVAIGRDELCSGFTIGEIVWIKEGKAEMLIIQDEIYATLTYDIGFREADSQ